LCAARKEVRERTYEMFAKVDRELGKRIRKSTEEEVKKAEEEVRKSLASPRL
jgi:catalase